MNKEQLEKEIIAGLRDLALPFLYNTDCLSERIYMTSKVVTESASADEEGNGPMLRYALSIQP